MRIKDGTIPEGFFCVTPILSFPYLSQISAKLEPENVVVIATVWHNALSAGPADSAGDIAPEGS